MLVPLAVVGGEDARISPAQYGDDDECGRDRMQTAGDEARGRVDARPAIASRAESEQRDEEDEDAVLGLVSAATPEPQLSPESGPSGDHSDSVSLSVGTTMGAESDGDRGSARSSSTGTEYASAPSRPSHNELSSASKPNRQDGPIPNPMPALATASTVGPKEAEGTVQVATAHAAVEAEETSGRAGRRARSSVSYKEPSLNK